MSRKKDPFDVEALLDQPLPITPVPIEVRVQTELVRPYLNAEYFARQLPGGNYTAETWNQGASYSFACPVCGGGAQIGSGYSAIAGPLGPKCNGTCTPEALRSALHAIAPLAFEVRDDVLFPFTPEFEDKLTASVVANGSLLIEKEQAAARRKFRSVSAAIRTFRYTGPSGDAVMLVFRNEKKRFLPARVTVDASDIAHVEFLFPDGLLPIYNWSELVARPDAPVLVVEGESTADAARALFPDYVVTTSACGSSNARKSDWSPLHDRDVFIWRDNDPPGKKYERSVAAHAHAVRARSVRAVTLPPGLPETWDLADDLPDGLTADDLIAAVQSAIEVRWDDVKDALARDGTPQKWPPFRLPDGLLAARKEVLKEVEAALKHVDPGCRRGPWLGVLGAVHHALGEAGFELADSWSKRDADKHRKYCDGEVRRIFDALAAAPLPSPMTVLTLFRIAMKQASERAGDDAGKAWQPESVAFALAHIADFERDHRKVTLGDNVAIAIQECASDGTYSFRTMSEANAKSVSLRRKAPGFDGDQTNLFTLWENNQLIPPLKLVFKPGQDVEPDELNLFRGLDVQPTPGGSYGLFREHLDAVMAANGDTDGYLWKLLAYRMQNLATFVPALLVLIGPEGSGKTSVAAVIARLLAPYSAALSDPEKFVGRNNASLQGKLHVQLEEMILGRKEEYDSRLKHYITSPTLDVEEKYKAQWQIPNHLFVTMTANKMAAVRVTEHSRRFAMYEVPDRFGGQAARERFFGAMYAELENGGYEALAYDLQQVDLAAFSPAAVPKTKLLLELAGQDADRDPLRGWWRHTLESGVLCEADGKNEEWFTDVSKDNLYNRYRGWCENDGSVARTRVLSKAEWAKGLGKMLPGGLVAPRKMVAGKRSQFVSAPPYEECCAHFERLFGTTIDRAPQPGQLRSVM